MKNYDEMTENVFRRRDAHAVRQRKKRIVGGVAGTVVMACLACVIFLGQNAPQTVTGTLSAPFAPSQTVQQTQPPTVPSSEPECVQPQLVLLARTTDLKEATLEENVRLPLAYYIDVTDIRGLNTEEEVRTLMDRQRVELDDYLMELEVGDEIRGICHSRVLRRENYIISTLRCGSFRLCVDRSDDIETVTVETSGGYGEITVHQGTFDDTHSYDRGSRVTVGAELLKDGELFVDWMYSTDFLDALEADPAAPLTGFSDSVVITVAYGDGSKQSCGIDLIVNEDGTVWALLRSQQTDL